jgi:ABC-type multidrug transport system fused ATPase/permease subunit
MQETVLLKGKSKVTGSIAYVEQEPFIIPGTIKENITFGAPYDKPRMIRAIRLSQLARDLEYLGNKLETIIGERGVNVSGG